MVLMDERVPRSRHLPVVFLAYKRLGIAPGYVHSIYMYIYIYMLHVCCNSCGMRYADGGGGGGGGDGGKKRRYPQ